MTSPRETRRQFLNRLALAGAGGLMLGVGGSPAKAATYGGGFLINIQLSGGLDVTSFIDPKTNQPGKPIMNNWAKTAEVVKSGNLSYAPFAENAKFFDKYYKDALIINGVDMQTNSHTVGVRHNWSGRNSGGFPSLTALFAGVKQTAQAMPYLSFGGFAATQGVTSMTQVGNMTVLRNLIEPTLAEASAKAYLPKSDWERITAMHAAGLEARSKATSTLEAASILQLRYADALLRSGGISNFAEILPAANRLQATRRFGNAGSSLHQQLQIALLAFKAGVSLSADVIQGGFDTHANQDDLLSPLLAGVTDALDYAWTYAAELGIADRLTVVMGSDFGRTPGYNSGNGKDHWPISSMLVMQKNAGFANRVVGLSDPGHRALAINPQTLQADSKGITLKPAHVHKALRKRLGLADSPLAQLFPFSMTEDLPIFG